MSHEVENAAYSLLPAWHGLGTVTEEMMTAERALELVPELASPVILEPVIRRVEKWDPKAQKMRGYQETVEGHFLTIREFDNKPLGVVGSQYQVLQNTEALSLLDSLTGAKQAKYESVISLKGGKVATMLVNLTDLGVKIGGEDPVACYALLMNSHDGSTAVRFQITPVRVVCNNTLQLALRGTGPNKPHHVVNVRHSTNMHSRLAEIERIMEITQTYMSDFEASAVQLMNSPMSEKQWEEFLGKLVVMPEEKKAVVLNKNGKPASDPVRTSRENRRAELTALWHNLDRTAAMQYSGTKWGALQAVSYWNQRMGTVRAKGASVGNKVINPNWEADAERARREGRFLRTLSGNNANLTDKAYELLSV